MHNNDQDEVDVLSQIRLNVAFEQLIVSVLTGAFAGGMLSLLLGLGTALFGGVVSFSVLLAVVLETLLVCFLIFLAGFLSSIIVGAPLFMAQEKAKRREMWPFLAASLAISVVIFSFVTGHIPIFGDFSWTVMATIFVPAIVIPLMFGRLMAPHWRAAEKADEARGVVIRMH